MWLSIERTYRCDFICCCCCCYGSSVPGRLFFGTIACSEICKLSRAVACHHTMHSMYMNWEIKVHLKGLDRYPELICESGMWPDIVLHSPLTKQVLLLELSVSWESRIFKPARLLGYDWTDILQDFSHERWVQEVRSPLRHMIQ